MRIITQRQIAVRGFNNEKFNTRFGKGLFRRAMLNGSIELGDPKEKYLIDLYDFANWQHTARSNYQIDVFRNMLETGAEQQDDLLLSWIQHYDPLTKNKMSVDGYCVYLPSTRELHVAIDDPEHGTVDSWTLTAQLCRSTGLGKPVFVASNIDLDSW